MTALSDALASSQAKAVAALGKAYIRRADEPDDDLFRGLLVKIGCDDDTAIAFLLSAWKVLREENAEAPGEQAPKVLDNRIASPAQKKLIEALCKEKGLPYPDDVQTWEQAHGIIDAIKAGTYNADEWRVPF